MDGKLPRSTHKRPYVEDFDDDDDDLANKPPKQKKVRFPKGKKVKAGDEVLNFGKTEEDSGETKNPRLVAKERAKRRSQITEELFSEEVNDISAAEVSYEDNENFVEDGIQIEPFNLDKEREEGYYDAAGNFVEYVNENQIKDAWLDSFEVEERYTGKISMVTNDGNESHELSSEDIGTIKRRIANLLEPGETVLQALRRLKGSSNKRKEKMSADTQRLFDQLTEDANKLLDNGEYNVYHDKQKIFQREAEGYERLAMARGKTSTSASQEDRDYNAKTDSFSDVTGLGATSSVTANTNVASSNPNASTSDNPSNGDAAYDMFADDDDNATEKPASDSYNLHAMPNTNGVGQLSSDGPQGGSETGATGTDYIYDEASGYYYSNSTGYYYDPSTGMYCHSTSGQWYSFNEETGMYDIVNEAAPNAT